MRADIRWLVIVNPASGRPDDGAGWRAIEDALRRAGVAFDLIHTEQPELWQSGKAPWKVWK